MILIQIHILVAWLKMYVFVCLWCCQGDAYGIWRQILAHIRVASRLWRLCQSASWLRWEIMVQSPLLGLMTPVDRRRWLLRPGTCPWYHTWVWDLYGIGTILQLRATFLLSYDLKHLQLKIDLSASFVFCWFFCGSLYLSQRYDSACVRNMCWEECLDLRENNRIMEKILQFGAQ
jgi:hypothetical protein